MAFPADFRAEIYGALRDRALLVAHYLYPGNLEAQIHTQEVQGNHNAVETLEELKPYRTAIYALFATRIISSIVHLSSSEESTLHTCSKIIAGISLVGYVPALALFGMKINDAFEEINR